MTGPGALDSGENLSRRPPSPREGGRGGGRGGQGVRALQRRALRDPGTAALALFTLGSIAAAVFGPALVPKPGNLSPEGGSFNIRLRLPDGATLEETERQVRGVEKPLEQLAKTGEVERFWSSASAGQALVRVEVRARDRRPDRLAVLATRLRYQIPGARGGAHRDRRRSGGRRRLRARSRGPRQGRRGRSELPHRAAQRRSRCPLRSLPPGPGAPRSPQGALLLDHRLGRSVHPAHPAPDRRINAGRPRRAGHGSRPHASFPPCPSPCRRGRAASSARSSSWRRERRPIQTAPCPSSPTSSGDRSASATAVSGSWSPPPASPCAGSP